jgi:predicted SnoaL-like aldol condensation-catalyzing enzyme
MATKKKAKTRTSAPAKRGTAPKRKAVPRRKAAPKRKAVAKKPVVSEQARLERNKKLVIAFYQKLIGDKDAPGARRFMGEPYKQHSPYARDGFEGVAEFVQSFKAMAPNHHYEIKKVIAEGDFVVLHLHGISGMHPHGEQVVDFFRLKDGKVVEHWDVIQAIPENSENPNGIF